VSAQSLYRLTAYIDVISFRRLRHCAASRKVAGLRPNEVNAFSEFV
jgi:hypothetical protein